ncbi:HAD family hydrolase [Haloferula chungangensis]|uniref:HAD family hydrolase n=1 Tax=Haloferula chungangensis TaxID=1048331 RepID=A0ABW2LC93_9BACT
MTSEQLEKFERGLALFDFDGTMISWDTQILFANYVLRQEPVRRSYFPLFLGFTPFAGILGDEGMKRIFLSYLWKTEPAQLEEWVRGFVAEWVPGKCYAELIERMERHREAGHLTLLVSASPELYIREIGRVLGFDLAFGTPVEVGEKMKLFPDLRNHKSEEKVRRLSELLGPPREGVWPRSHGYTDSTADLPMMYCCEAGTVVNPSERLKKIAEERDWEVLTPTVPWKGKVDKLRQMAAFILGMR